jgi:hypothetical protein
MATLLARVVRHLGVPRRVPDLVVARWGTAVTVRGGDLARRRSQVQRSARSHNGSRAAFATAATELAWRVWDRRPGATRTESDDRGDFDAWLRTDPAFRRLLDDAWPVLLPPAVMARLQAGDLPLRDLAGDLFDDAELAALRDGWGPARHLSAADTAVWDELSELLGAPPVEVDEDDAWDELADLDDRARASEVTTFADRTARSRRNVAEEHDYRTFAHVVVDEAQDVTPMQWRMLARRGRGATWTVVGDWVQSAWPDVDEVRRALDGVVGKARLRQVELTTNYRTSTEIAALAARLLARIDPAATPPAAVRSTGVEPLLQVGDPLELLLPAVEELLGAVGGTVGVIAPHALVPAVGGRLGGLLEEHARLSVVDPWQVKGLEYDGCVVVDPHGIVDEARTELAGLRSTYVALTRATQRLAVLSRQPLDSLLLPQG